MNASFLIALFELIESAQLSRQWRVLADIQLNRRFQKSLFGKAWDLLNFILMVTTLAYLFSILFEREFAEYWLYLASGFSSWLLISSVLSEGTSVFVRNMIFVRELPLPILIYTWALLWKVGKVFLTNLLFAVGLSIWLHGLSVNLLILIPGMVLVMILSYSLILTFGIIGSRFRDLAHFMPNILRALFFLTPILWTLDRREELQWLVDYNPFFYIIEVVRAPLMGIVPDFNAYLIVSLITLLMSFIAVATYSVLRQKIVYWL